MSRVIKFRAWNKEESRMIDLNGFDIAFKGLQKEGEVTAAIEQGNLYMYDSDDVEIMQFTGMLTDGGVEIYEDDIFVDDESDSEFGTASFGRVKYDESQAKFIVVDWRGENQGDLDEWQSAPIVGNAHQNPDLMGDEL